MVRNHLNKLTQMKLMLMVLLSMLFNYQDNMFNFKKDHIQLLTT